MKHPLEKNFIAFISLLLEGSGTALILLPDHLGLNGSVYSSGVPILLGFLCFLIALALQGSCVWQFQRKWDLLIQGLALPHLFSVSFLLMQSGQTIGSFALLAAGVTQIFFLLRFSDRLKQLDFSRLAISLITFITGMILSISGFEPQQAEAVRFMPFLAAGFLITAFLAGATVILPSFRYDRLLNQLQILPWTALAALFVLSPGRDNLITPAAVITMALLERSIPWDRLVIPKIDILSRRVALIGSFVGIVHLIFLGSLLFVLDPNLNDRGTPLLSVREASFVFFLIFAAMVYYVTTTVIMTTSGLIQELNRGGDAHGEDPGAPDFHSGPWGGRLERYIKPFIMTPEGIRGRIQADQINVLARQAAVEKKRNAQLTLLLELSQQFENQLDQPVSAQLAVNTLERALNCALAMVFLHEPETREFMLLAAAGRHMSMAPAGYRQSVTKGAIGRALRQRKTQVINDARYETEYVSFEGETELSGVVVPLILNGHIIGAIAVNNETPNSFGSVEVGMAEMVAAELVRAWERSGHHQRLMELVQSGSKLTSTLDPETAAQEAAGISREILQAKFTYIYIQLGQERNFIQSASSGDAPLLLESLTDSLDSKELIQMALQASQPFRIRDVRKYDKTFHLALDNPGLRSMLAIPIRWHQVNIGAIFAFGKQNETFFTENDESLAELISIQAGGAFESTWLQQELRASLRITSLLYRLSNQIIQAENIEDAASDIAQTAHKLAKNLTTGIVLLDPDNRIIAEVRIDEEGRHLHSEHPMSLIHDAIASGQMIYISQEQSILRTCLPIQTPIRSYGAIWMDTFDDPNRKTAANPNDLQALVNQAAVALERSLLLVESRRQAKEIKAAYDTLAETYDQTLASLTSALDARDRETEGHSSRVTRLALMLGESLGYTQEQLKILERGALLHDIGKIGISDTILHKPGPLTPDEWKIMKLHPDIGAKIVEGIPFLQDTLPVIRSHQERWDGSGYPDGLKGKEIPELARLFAVVDAFDALTSNRPYRQKISKEAALGYLREQAGILFDPKMVLEFENLVVERQELMRE